MKISVACFWLLSSLFFAQAKKETVDDLFNGNGNGWKLGRVKRYLEANGYTDKKNPKPDEVKRAIRKFRILYKFDDNTDPARLYEFMEKPRCGNKDIKKRDSRRRRRYNVYLAWSKKTFKYAFESFTNDLSQADQKRIIADAFQLWKNAVSELSFTETTKLADADIKFSFAAGSHAGCGYPFDGQGLAIAHAYFPEDGRIHFDEDEIFTDQQSAGINLYAAAIHEIGHVLGVDHSYKESAVMYPVYKGFDPNPQLHSDDVNAIKALYDPNFGSPECVDEDASLCVAYQNAGYCAEFPDVMQEVCSSTCNLC